MTLFKDILANKKFSMLTGVVLLTLAILILCSCSSYLFTWKEDQDLLGAASYFDESLTVANDVGPVGFGFGHFLVGDCFGLAALLLGLILAIVAVKLMIRGRVDLFKAILGTLALPLAFSLLLAWVAVFFGNGLDSLFDGGIGGGMGLFLVKSLNSLFACWMSLFLILIFLLILVILLDDRVVNLFRPTPEKSVAVAESIEALPENDLEEASDIQTGDTETVVSISHVQSVDAEVDTSLSDGQTSEDPVSIDIKIDSPEDELSTRIDEELPQIDIKGEVGRYTMPPLDLLEDYADKRFTLPDEELRRNVEKIKATLAAFKIPVDGISASVGYTVTLYKITLGDGVRVNSVKNLEDDIAIKIGIKGVRIVILSDAVGIEVPNDKPSIVPLKAILNSDAFRNSKAELPIALGYTITTKAKVFDLTDAPHLLVAGATKQGKSVGLNAIISSLLYSKHPTELKFVFVDPKMVEFQQYGKLLKHYLAVLPAGPDNPDQSDADRAIVKYPKDAEEILRSLCVEMDDRYKLMSEAGVNKVTDYNEKFRNRHLLPTAGHRYFPYLVIVIDEYADLTKASFGTDKNISRSIENSINRLAAKGRAAGLHIIIATQRPSVDVITGTIKGNFPTRIAFRTASRQDSMTILGQPGADRLIGKGDMLYFTGADAERVQCALVGTEETDKLTRFVAEQVGFRQSCSQPYYLPDPGNLDGSPSDGGDGRMVDMSHLDELFKEAANIAVLNGSISTSMLQRKMSLGFARAGKIMDQLESAGIVGPQCGAKPREVLVPDLASLQPILDAFVK